MIADKVLSGIKSWIESQQSINTEVDGLSIVLRDTTNVKSYPLLVLNDTGATEHPVLRGVWAPLTVEAMLYSVPNADGASASGTTQAQHQAVANALYQVLNDTAAIVHIDALTGLRCFDIRGGGIETTTEDNRLVTRILLDVVCAQET